MESTEIRQAINLLEANISELAELAFVLNSDPILRGKTISRLIEQNNKLYFLANSLDK
jgi:hypothetical protein